MNDATSLTDTSLEDTRVHIVFPLAFIGVFACAQLYLGADPLVTALCFIGVATPFIPLHLYGRDIYSVVGVIFSLRYAGAALMAKTAYGQPLQQHLFEPVTSYMLNAVIMASVTAVLLIARGLDRGTVLFPMPEPPDLDRLRRLAIIGMSVGFASQIVAGASTSTESGVATSGIGPVAIIFGLFATLFYLGMVAEVVYGVTKSQGRNFVTPLLVVALGVALLVSLALNWREFFVTAVIGVAVTAFMYKAIRFHHVLAGLLVLYFFVAFLSPVTLYLRVQRTGMPRPQFISLALETVQRAAIDPEFRATIRAGVSANAEMTDATYDYYGDRSDTLNRFSYIGLLDGVSALSHNTPLLGMSPIYQNLARIAPGFLGFDKRSTIYGAGDWLWWQLGIGVYGQIGFANFGLPMEGLVSWGFIGLMTYPFIFILPYLFFIAKISSLRRRLPYSIFLFVTFQHSIVEGTSDFFIGMLRGIPEMIVLNAVVYYAFFNQRAASPRNLSGPLPNESQLSD